MDEATAIEIAQEWVRREQIADFDEVRTSSRVIAQSLVSMLPETDDWAVIDTETINGVVEADRYIYALDNVSIFRAFSQVQESGVRVIGCERIRLGETHLQVTDHEIPEAGAHRFFRNWTVTVPGNPSVFSFTIDWIREAEERLHSREERLGYALAAALGWQLGQVPLDLRP